MADRDPHVRKQLFDRFLEIVGVADSVHTVWEDDALFVRTNAPEKYELWFSSSRPDKGNPGACEIRGFESLEAAWAAMQRALAVFGQEHSVDQAEYYATMTPEVYERLRQEFSAIGRGWELELFARLRQPLPDFIASYDPAGGEIERIPAFEWEERRRGYVFQADMVLSPEGLSWEITTNCMDVDYARKRSEQVVGQPLTPVESCVEE